MAPTTSLQASSYLSGFNSSEVIPSNSNPGAEVQWRLPAHSWDTHVHIFDPQVYPYDPDRQYTPMSASYAELLDFNANVSSTRTPQNIVFVQPSPYGTDNALILDTLRNRYSSSSTDEGDGDGGVLRAIVVIDPASATDEQLDEMDALGVRGVRVNAQGSGAEDGYVGLGEALREAGERVAAFERWMLQVYASGESWDYISDVVRELPLPVIADHQAGMQGLSALPTGITDVTMQPGFASLMSLAKEGKVYVKVSAFYRSSELTTGGYDDVEHLIRVFAREIPQQLIWGSDWPHTGSNRSEATKYVPEPFREVDNEAVLRNLLEWVGPELYYNMTGLRT
ncbi:hypothetical protein MPH_00099 [Macrophomina phaseolina MS6]|uniref:Amidohydrolase-related domain-containing protein n=1 Tax=Macrophomina phaseolina (strain MS6) TaxID=1126212 RepID=K2RIY6_MACPH|nr:hypothetical protein MPH_00099 [Macrophomina phaseolina MS6]